MLFGHVHTHTHTHTRASLLWWSPVFTALLTDALDLIKDVVLSLLRVLLSIFVYDLMKAVSWYVCLCTPPKTQMSVLPRFLDIYLSATLYTVIFYRASPVIYCVSDRGSLCRLGAPAKSGKEIFHHHSAPLYLLPLEHIAHLVCVVVGFMWGPLDLCVCVFGGWGCLSQC